MFGSEFESVVGVEGEDEGEVDGVHFMHLVYNPFVRLFALAYAIYTGRYL